MPALPNAPGVPPMSPSGGGPPTDAPVSQPARFIPPGVTGVAMLGQPPRFTPPGATGGAQPGQPQMPVNGQFPVNGKPPGLPAGFPQAARPSPNPAMASYPRMAAPPAGGAFGGLTKAPTLAGQGAPIVPGRTSPR